MSTQIELVQRIDALEKLYQSKRSVSEPREEQLNDVLATISTKLAKMDERQVEEGFSLNKIKPNRSDMTLAVAGIGAASAGSVRGFLEPFLSSMIPAGGFFGLNAGDIAQLVGGWIIYKGVISNNQYVKAFGGGVVIEAIAGWARDQGFTLGKFLPSAGAAVSTGSGAALTI